jgi:hypothetical protein
VVDVVDVLWLGVKGIVVHVFVVDAILFTSGNTDFLRVSLSALLSVS